MDQLKLLNFHKMLANFANNLVGAFVPLIIYQATNNLTYAILYLLANSAIRLTITFSLKKLYGKYPQLFLLLRVIPIALYNVFIFVMDVNIIVGIVGVCIFLALDNSLNNLSKEIIFNYSSLSNKSDNSIGITRLFEQIGIIVALLVGGYLLDFNKTIVLILSLSIYAISVIPLVTFYIKSRKEKTFNQDATSNAVNTLNKDSEYHQVSLKLSKKLLITYSIIYFSFAAIDLLQNSYSLRVFILNGGVFSTTGILNAVYHCFYAIGFYVAGIMNEKKDITKQVMVVCILIGICAISLYFINVSTYFIPVCIIYGLIGFCYPFISLFVLQRMLIKSRIMGISNQALFQRESSCVFNYIFCYCFGFFGLIGIFIVMGVTMIASAFIIPYCEERTRRHLVDYLQNNEISNNSK